MKPLVNLFINKKWGAVRNTFRKPLPAIITLIVVALYAFALGPALLGGDKRPLDEGGLQVILLLSIGFTLMFVMSMYLQKHKALFFLQDSYYMFTGPFRKKQVLTYLVFETVLSALLLALFSLVFVAMVGSTYAVGLGGFLLVLAALFLVQYVFIALMDYLYIRAMVRGKKSRAPVLVILGLLVCLAAAFGWCAVQTGFDMAAAWGRFMSSHALSAVPLLGWVRLALAGVFTGNALWAALGYGLLSLAVVGISLALVNIRGDFYEQAMLDAEDFTEYYEKAKAGRIEAKVKKGTFKQKWRAGAGAVLSKNWLIVRKTALLRPYDILVVGAYVAVGLMMSNGVLPLMIMLVFYQFADASASQLVEDLKRPYIYLIPGKPLNKLLASLAVPVAKNMLVCCTALAVSGIVMREGVLDIVAACLLSASFSLLTATGNVVSLRIMRGRNSQMVEQVLRMVVVLLALAPSAGLLFVFIRIGFVQPLVSQILVALITVVLGLAILAACSPMMNGRELDSD